MKHISIPIPPITKKNSQRIVMCGRHPRVLPSKQYCEYEKKALPYLKSLWQGEDPVSTPSNLKMTFYMPTRRRVDLVNLQEACLDVLVKAGVIEDDNCKIVSAMDGSAVRHDKDHPRTEIEITEIGSRAEIGAEMAEEVDG